VVWWGGFDNGERVKDVFLQADGKTVVIGNSGDGFERIFLERFNQDGSLDSTFGGGDGRVLYDPADVPGPVTPDSPTRIDPVDIKRMPDGDLVVLGTDRSLSTGRGFALIRFNGNGTLDTSFGGGDGLVIQREDLGGDDTFAVTLEVGPDGKLYAGGQGGGFVSALLRFTGAGVLDSTFDGDGIRLNAIPGTDGVVREITFASGGKIVVGGTDSSDLDTIARLNNNGTFDSTFSGDGLVQAPEFYDLAVAPDGGVIASIVDPSGLAAIRFSSTGVRDTKFGNGGVANVSIGPGEVQSLHVAIQTDGSIDLAGTIAGEVISGHTLIDSDLALARFFSNGQTDQSFGSGGKVVTSLNDQQNVPFDLTWSSANGGTLSVVGRAFNIDPEFGVDPTQVQTMFAARFQAPPVATIGINSSRVLVANGTASADTFSVVRVGIDDVTVTVDGLSRTFDMDDFDSIVFNGQDGNDTMTAGAGVAHLTMNGGNGNDRLTGNALANVFHGGGGNDYIVGGDGVDALFGDAGFDTLNGQNGNDHLEGGDGNDTLTGGAGNDTMLGQAGDDTFYARDGAKDTVDGGSGTADRAQRDGIDSVVNVEQTIA
jgi:uncharacterized delta-60 repeat protein